ncbi:MAG: hypothetical protein J2P21_00605 [Chloracidobacterium sp.]|nr:hypothetical protein [Chloracidobacterium sp.]
MLEWRPPRGAEIDKKLRDDFRRMLKEYGVSAQETDPILALLMRSFSEQIAEVYEQAAENIPLAILDELMSGLGMPDRRARAAQTVVRFDLLNGRESFESMTELIGETGSREKLTFTLDTSLDISTARIALVAIYKDGMLRMHHGTEMAKEMEDARPSFDPAPAELGNNPAIYIAIDVDDAEHLSQHGFYFELLPEARDLAAYLKREVWCLIDDDGGIRAEGLLRPRAANGGVRNLEWMVGGGNPAEKPLLPEGFYGGRIFVLPPIPAERRFLTRIPMKMEAPLARIFQQPGQAGQSNLFDRPRAWLRIGLPKEAANISEDLIRIALHCATASNIESLNQTISFNDDGAIVPLTTGGGRARRLVRMLSVKGNRGATYLPDTEPSADEGAGRYRIRQNRLEIEPARDLRGAADSYVNVRALLSNGELGNDVAAGGIKGFLNRATPRTLEIRNVTGAAGGDNGASLMETRRRFTEILLSRERPVTYPDLEAMTMAFEPRIRSVEAEPRLERGPDGLHRVQWVTVTLDSDAFVLPDVEGEILKRELEASLQERSLLGLEVRVSIKLE